MSCRACEGFAEVLVSPTPEGDVEVGHCLHEECRAWFSLPWAQVRAAGVVVAASAG